MNIVVLGHSNSILVDGWVPAMAERRPADKIVNLSIGGSPSPSLLYMTLSSRYRIGPDDVVIVEPTVVDHGEHWQSPENIAGQAIALLSLLRPAQARIAVLILPRHPEYVNAPSLGMKAWEAMAREQGIPVIDGSNIIRDYADSGGVALEDLWRDRAGHTIAAVQRHIGHAVATRVDTIKSQTPGLAGALPNLRRAITGDVLAGSQPELTKTRTSSLITASCLSLAAGDRVNLALAADEAVLGFAVNYGATDPTQPMLVELHGATQTVRYDLANKFLSPSATGRLAVMFQPCNSPFGISGLSVPAVAGNERFARAGTERIELAGILVGPPISPVRGWEISMPPSPMPA